MDSVAGNYPNPFSPDVESTTVEYFLDAPQKVSIRIYTLTGAEVQTLMNLEDQAAGLQKVLWDGRNSDGVIVRNGVYLCVIQAGQKKTAVKIMVIR
jgi:flagellar hook assembly protein FlgD